MRLARDYYNLNHNVLFLLLLITNVNVTLALSGALLIFRISSKKNLKIMVFYGAFLVVFSILAVKSFIIN